MPILAFNFKKIDAERTGNPNQQMTINTTPTIKDVRKGSLSNMGQNMEIAQIDFEFKSTFDPKVGFIKIEGELIYSSSNISDVIDSWNKNKKLPLVNDSEVINYIIRNITIKVMQIGDLLKLPPVIKLPRYQPKEAEKGASKKSAGKKASAKKKAKPSKGKKTRKK